MLLSRLVQYPGNTNCTRRHRARTATVQGPSLKTNERVHPMRFHPMLSAGTTVGLQVPLLRCRSHNIMHAARARARLA